MNLITRYYIDCADFASAQQTYERPARVTSTGRNKMSRIKKCLLFVCVVCAFACSVVAQSTPTPTPLPVKNEPYGTAPTGVPLSWKAIEPDPVLFPGPRPAILVVHEGGYRNNNPGNMDVAQDLAMLGYLA